jgi:hypothetical protein
MNDRKVTILALVVILLVAWYTFRPERLVVNQRVHEELPAAKGEPPPSDVRTTMNVYGAAYEESKRRANALVAGKLLAGKKQPERKSMIH